MSIEICYDEHSLKEQAPDLLRFIKRCGLPLTIEDATFIIDTALAAGVDVETFDGDDCETTLVELR